MSNKIEPSSHRVQVAASMVRAEPLYELLDICETQKSISTKKLDRLLQKVHRKNVEQVVPLIMLCDIKE